MKKNYENGFILVEAIVVGVFLIELLSILIINVLPLIGEYEKSFRYDNIDRKYDINLIRKTLLYNNTNISLDSVNYNIYSNSELTNFCNNLTSLGDYCEQLMDEDYLGVKTLIISTYNISNLKNSNNNNLSRGLKEYINYLPSNSTHDNKYNNYKRLIVEFKDNTFASIEVPYE